ncbi:MAG TPA: NAD/NADP octopine/nopaline dehydrogenase family protein [Aliicoccus persicus]|uniref:6-phosphogluconate dehydrogenase, decarboxylating n=1 Tax=Aliicoccus persicus TaxID=930138 RepID=A0A921B627_9STAP|nr:NAD/NADP octopine/nopaline dehydrogenase family protein [Aliicoccus persicus]
MALKIAIFGAGNGGVAAALEMTERGHEVTIHHDRTRMEGLDTLKKTKTATLNGKEISFHSFTNDASEAVAGKDVLMLTVPAFAIEDVAQSIVPHLEDDQMIYINSASALGALRFRNIMDAQDINKSVKVGDSMSLTYASRYDKDTNEATIYGHNQYNMFSAYPSTDTEDMLAVLSQMYDHLKPAKNIIEVVLNNGNPESHPGPSILNAGRIDYAGDSFYLYTHGMTEHTINVVHDIDHERQEICRKLGFEALDKSSRSVRSGYFKDGLTLLEQYHTSDLLKDLLGPTHLENRYITEDVSNGLVLWSSIGDAVGVETPTMDAVIQLTGVLLKRNYFDIGVTLEKLGIDVDSAEALNELM